MWERHGSAEKVRPTKSQQQDVGRSKDARRSPHDARKVKAEKRSVRILEPACGSGRLALELARRGHSVAGFDLNEAMLARARSRLSKHALHAQLVRADMRRFRLDGRFEIAHCLVSTFKYLLDETSAREHLECVARHLVPGGVYVLGFHLTDYDSESQSCERWTGTSGRARVTCNTRVWPADRRTRLEDVRARLVVERTGDVLRTETRWRFRSYDERQARRLIAKVSSFECVALHDFHYDVERPRAFGEGILDCVFVLKKRGARAFSR
jgi:SAM-dependent methyltransferase